MPKRKRKITKEMEPEEKKATTSKKNRVNRAKKKKGSNERMATGRKKSCVFYKKPCNPCLKVKEV